jgi:alpha-1,3-mannosylglycoprotein beta-1,4-N-acetylglucosaminyltransferase A/B
MYICELCILPPSGKFDGMGVAEGAVDPQLGAVKVLRLNVHSESDNWAILSEVSVHDTLNALCCVL